MNYSWVPVKGYEGRYEINGYGQIKSLPKSFNDKWGNVQWTHEKIIQPTFRPESSKYVYGLTNENGKLRQHYMHILVADSFNREVQFINLPDEIWKPVAASPRFEVSTAGRVRVRSRVYDSDRMTFCEYKRITPNENGHGYLFITDHKKRLGYVHRLVAEAFIPNPNELPQVDHLDAVRSHNAVTNLEWVTAKENHRRVLLRGHQRRGTKAVNSKLTSTDIQAITKLKLDGVSGADIVRRLNLPRGVVYRFLQGASYHAEKELIISTKEGQTQ